MFVLCVCISTSFVFSKVECINNPVFMWRSIIDQFCGVGMLGNTIRRSEREHTVLSNGSVINH